MTVEPKYVRTLLNDEDGDPYTILNPLPVTAGDGGSLSIRDPISGEEANVDWDGTYSALAVMDSRMKIDVDDDGIAHSQVLPLNIVENYGYDTTEGLWSRFKLEYDNDDIRV